MDKEQFRERFCTCKSRCSKWSEGTYIKAHSKTCAIVQLGSRIDAIFDETQKLIDMANQKLGGKPVIGEYCTYSWDWAAPSEVADAQKEMIGLMMTLCGAELEPKVKPIEYETSWHRIPEGANAGMNEALFPSKEHIEKLQRIAVLFQTIVHAARLKGFNEGRQLIMRLAAGDLTMGELNDRVINEHKRLSDLG